MNFSPEVNIWIVLVGVLGLIVCLVRNVIRPSILFFFAVLLFIISGIITPDDLLKNYSNKQIITIFLLIILTASLRKNFNTEVFMSKIFPAGISSKGFLVRMMAIVAFFSSFLNNTPVVAFMTPYVYSWSKANGTFPSKYLIPLSYAAILGGMITIIGTSTNLVLNGFLEQNNLPLLHWTDFFYLGVIVTISGMIFLFFIGYKMLPYKKYGMEDILEKSREYLVEANIGKDSSLIGKSVSEGGLRSLKGVYLFEIIRSGKSISPVSPDEILEAKDELIFAGNTEQIADIMEAKDLSIPKQEFIVNQKHDRLIEVVIPGGSFLPGKIVKQSRFREKFNAAIIAIHRNGVRLKGKIGEMKLEQGDLLLLSVGQQFRSNIESYNKDLQPLSNVKKIEKKNYSKLNWVLIGLFAVLGFGFIGWVDLFTSLLIISAIFVATGVLKVEDIKKDFDINLAVILGCSLTIGDAMLKTGAAHLVAENIISIFQSQGAIGIMVGLYLLTLVLTSFVTNVAAVSISFPIANQLSEMIAVDSTALYVSIAFAASAAFISPFGYQTNLIVYGPGRYTFNDFFKVGFPLTILYSFICTLFIAFYYNL